MSTRKEGNSDASAASNIPANSVNSNNASRPGSGVKPVTQDILVVTLTPKNVNSPPCSDPTTYTSFACIPVASQTPGLNMTFDSPASLFCGPDDEVNLRAETEAAELQGKSDASQAPSRSSLDMNRQSQPIISKYWMRVKKKKGK